MRIYTILKGGQDAFPPYADLAGREYSARYFYGRRVGFRIERKKQNRFACFYGITGLSAFWPNLRQIAYQWPAARDWAEYRAHLTGGVSTHYHRLAFRVSHRKEKKWQSM